LNETFVFMAVDVGIENVGAKSAGGPARGAAPRGTLTTLENAGDLPSAVLKVSSCA
jgi:hypothetical protein